LKPCKGGIESEEIFIAQSLSSILIHLVFSTKHREPLITHAIEFELYAYLSGIFNNCKSPSLLINGMPDHVHALFKLHRTYTLSDVVEEVKRSSSKWIKSKGRELNSFQWQAGYGAFSIGQSNLASVKRYIAEQKEHHKERNFKDEFRALLKKYEVEYDERYTWD
jgi:putative transposase